MCRIFITTVLCVAAAFAQAPVPPEKGFHVQSDVAEFGPIGITTALAGPMVNVTGAPYSAQTSTERIQVLADGNRIVQSTSGSVARDGQGRTRREESLPALKGDRDNPHFVMIDDPVAHVHWTLDAQTKTAIKMQLPGIQAGPAGVVAGSGISRSKNYFFVSTDGPGSRPVVAGPSVMMMKNDGPSADKDEIKTDLGTQNVEGVPAQGTRVTRTIPAGQFGNEMPMVITTETWYSPDLKVLVMSKSSDPRMGDTTYTLTNIQRSEPDPSLFQVPDGYTVREASPATVQFQKIK